ncbi:unnamed protein product, partial [Mesorhabditis spiculigera]
MFEYDRWPDLGLNMRRRDETDFKNDFREISQAISAAQTIPREQFDCGSSSGYGSPGGTPLASPHSQPPGNVGLLPIHVQRAFRDAGYSIDIEPQPAFAHATSAMMPPISPITAATTPDKKKPAADDPNGPAPTEDGLSMDDIRAFEQLLCSPKKAPPSKYQCHICYQNGHYISDCPQRFSSAYDELTPYQGRKKCYGEFQCQHCKRKWTSQNSVANEAQSCIKCHVPVFPHKQLPVEKAVTLGLIKPQKAPPTKIAPIGHGRPPAAKGK